MNSSIPVRSSNPRKFEVPSCAAVSSRSMCSPTSASPAIRSRSCWSRMGSTRRRCRPSRASSICRRRCSCSAAGKQGAPRENPHLHACFGIAVRRSSDRRNGGVAWIARWRIAGARFHPWAQHRPGAVPRDTRRRRTGGRYSSFRDCRKMSARRPMTPRSRRRSALLRRTSASTDFGRRGGRRVRLTRWSRCATSMSIKRCHVETGHWKAAFGFDAHAAAYMFCRETAEPGHQFHTRMFAPLQGVSEDPATGSAAAAFAGYLAAHSGFGEGEHATTHRAGLRDGPPEPDRTHAEDRRRQADRRLDRRQRRGRDGRRDRGLTGRSAPATTRAWRTSRSFRCRGSICASSRRRGRLPTSVAPRSTRILRSCAPRSRRCGTGVCCCCAAEKS